MYDNFYLNFRRLNAQELKKIIKEKNIDVMIKEKSEPFLISLFYDNKNIIQDIINVYEIKDYIVIGNEIINGKDYYQALSFEKDLFSIAENKEYKKRFRNYMNSLNLSYLTAL